MAAIGLLRPNGGFSSRPASPRQLAPGKELVPLRAVGREIWYVVKTGPKLLDVNDLFTNCDPRPRTAFDITCGREVIGVRMGIKHPLKHVPLRLNVTEERVSGVG